MEFKLYVNSIVERQGKILLVQEAKEKHRGQWNFPGGHLEIGEQLTVGALREIKEETGLDAEITYFLGLYTAIKNNHSFRFTFVTKAEQGEAKALDNVLDCQLFTPEEILAMHDEKLVSAHILKRIVRDYQSGKRLPANIVEELSPPYEAK